MCWEMQSLEIRDHFVTNPAIPTNKDVPGYGPWTPLSCGLSVVPPPGLEPDLRFTN